MAFCSSCGKKIADGQKFCPICGAQQVDAGGASSGFSTQGFSGGTGAQPPVKNGFHPLQNGFTLTFTPETVWSLISMGMLLLNTILYCAGNFKLNTRGEDYILSKYTIWAAIRFGEEEWGKSGGIGFLKFLLYVAPVLMIASIAFIGYNAFVKKKGVDMTQFIVAGASVIYSFVIYLIGTIVFFVKIDEVTGYLDYSLFKLSFFGWIFFFLCVATALVIVVAKSKGPASSPRFSASSRTGIGRNV